MQLELGSNAYNYDWCACEWRSFRDSDKSSNDLWLSPNDLLSSNYRLNGRSEQQQQQQQIVTKTRQTSLNNTNNATMRCMPNVDGINSNCHHQTEKFIANCMLLVAGLSIASWNSPGQNDQFQSNLIQWFMAITSFKMNENIQFESCLYFMLRNLDNQAGASIPRNQFFLSLNCSWCRVLYFRLCDLEMKVLSKTDKIAMTVSSYSIPCNVMCYIGHILLFCIYWMTHIWCEDSVQYTHSAVYFEFGLERYK